MEYSPENWRHRKDVKNLWYLPPRMSWRRGWEVNTVSHESIYDRVIFTSSLDVSAATDDRAMFLITNFDKLMTFYSMVGEYVNARGIGISVNSASDTSSTFKLQFPNKTEADHFVGAFTFTEISSYGKIYEVFAGREGKTVTVTMTDR
jgi:hypothetical protein